ncbi:MAG: Trk family potassium uptake protein [Syntrophomonadaceae bacterium]|nr:Trk family potassium uptake protein [Syntrophomonadaceae bacterium]
MQNKKMSAPRLLVGSFLVLILLGSLLLSMPWAAHTPTSYVDALFTSATSVCITGLLVVDTGTHWTLLGQIIILLLIQVGGLGVMAFAGFFAMLMGRKIHLRERLLMQQSINVSAVGGIVRVFKYLLGFTFLLEALGAIILAIKWAPLMGLKRALWFGLFHSVSAFNNAGIDLFGSFKSLTAFKHDITVNIIISLLVIIGGLGFYVCYELYNYRKNRKLSLHSKVVLFTTVILIVLGTVLLLAVEYNHALKALTPGHKLMAAFFHSVSSRSSGFSTLDINSLLLPSQLILIIFMFIGASPGSTGGGIKTTTVALMVAVVMAQLRGKKDIEIFERRIEDSDIYPSFTLFFMAIFLLLIMTLLVSLTNPADFTKILFDVTSALGTVGLSTGLSTELNAFGKVLLVICMFLGRVGPLTLGFALAYKKKQPEIHYARGKIMIG